MLFERLQELWMVNVEDWWQQRFEWRYVGVRTGLLLGCESSGMTRWIHKLDQMISFTANWVQLYWDVHWVCWKHAWHCGPTMYLYSLKGSLWAPDVPQYFFRHCGGAVSIPLVTILLQNRLKIGIRIACVKSTIFIWPMKTWLQFLSLMLIHLVCGPLVKMVTLYKPW